MSVEEPKEKKMVIDKMEQLRIYCLFLYRLIQQFVKEKQDGRPGNIGGDMHEGMRYPGFADMLQPGFFVVVNDQVEQVKRLKQAGFDTRFWSPGPFDDIRPQARFFREDLNDQAGIRVFGLPEYNTAG